ncbi:hypothetical protein K1719_016197 [Acacia pycnantha]|nr:hypothetical protein K1719_016197 [Acacia pycnantha]
MDSLPEHLVGCGMDPANDALTSLCNRFISLSKVEITYSNWMSKLGKQLDDQGLLTLAYQCPSLSDLTLSYYKFINDVGLRYLAASCSKLSSLMLNFTPRITGCDKHEERAFVVKLSVVEIYNEVVRDLLSANSSTLRLRDDLEKGVIVKKLTEETLWD